MKGKVHAQMTMCYDTVLFYYSIYYSILHHTLGVNDICALICEVYCTFTVSGHKSPDTCVFPYVYCKRVLVLKSSRVMYIS